MVSRKHRVDQNEQAGRCVFHPRLISPVFLRAIQSRLPWTVFLRPKFVVIEHLFSIHRVVEFVRPRSSHCFRCGASSVAEVRCSMLKRTGKLKRIFEVKKSFTSNFLIFTEVVFNICSDPSLSVQFHQQIIVPRVLRRWADHFFHIGTSTLQVLREPFNVSKDTAVFIRFSMI